MHRVAGVLVYADGDPGLCKSCGGPMHVQKTAKRRGKTLAHGEFVVKETAYICAKDCRADGSVVVKRPSGLAEILPPRGIFGYDVMTFVGLQRFNHNHQRLEIKTMLSEQHGINLSTGEISNLMRRYLVYVAALHDGHAPDIRKVLTVDDGGYALHIDATCETGRGTLFVAYAGKRGWVLGAWKIGTERADAVLPKLKRVDALFGAPSAIVRDLSKALIEAALVFAGDREIAILACHQHFLKDVGKGLLKKPHDQLRDLVRRFKILARLRSLVRSLGRRIGKEMDAAREDVKAWLVPTDDIVLPEGEAGLAVVRAVAQWIIDYPADGKDTGFPFDRPYLDLYHRGQRALRAVESLMRRPSADTNVGRALRDLHRILSPVRSEVPFSRLARTLETRGALFDELRAALRLTEKAYGHPDKPRTSEQQIAELRDVEAALAALRQSLLEGRPERGPAQDLRDAIDEILEHLDRHGPNLWGHCIVLPDGRVLVVDRTNNVLEALFHWLKHNERRRSGRKNLTQDMEQLPAEALFAKNLSDPEYVKIITDGGGLEDLPRAFARLDAAGGALSPPARAKAKNGGQDGEIVSSSLPKPDRDLVRLQSMRDRVLAQARSRAPRIAPARAPGRAATVE